MKMTMMTKMKKAIMFLSVRSYTNKEAKTAVECSRSFFESSPDIDNDVFVALFTIENDLDRLKFKNLVQKKVTLICE